MTPMIDVIFLLLVFFLATSSFQIVEKMMPSGASKTAPTAGNAEQAQVDPTEDALDQIIVKLQRQDDRTIALLNEVALEDLSELEPRLRMFSQVRLDVPVVIDPAPEIPAADVVRAYDWARQAGLARVYLATRAE